MKKSRTICIAILCIIIISSLIGCEPKKETINNNNSNKVPFQKKRIHEDTQDNNHAFIIITNKAIHQANEVADFQKIRQEIQNNKTDPRNMTKAELKARALSALGMPLIENQDLKKKQKYNLNETANILLDAYIQLTSNDIAKISVEDPMRIFDVLDQLYYISSAKSGNYINDNRVKLIYQYLSEDNKPNDVRVRAMSEFSYFESDMNKRKEIIEQTIKLAEEKDSQYTLLTYDNLGYFFYQEREYDKSIEQGDKCLQWLDKYPDYELNDTNAESIRGGVYEMKIRCLSEKGEVEKALKLLNKIKDSDLISDCYKDEFNSEDFRSKVKNGFKGSRITRGGVM